MLTLNVHIEIREGRAYVVGHHHKAELVACMVVDEGHTLRETAEHYGLSLAQVCAALAFYYDNQAELDAQLAAKRQEIHTHADTLNTLKARLAAKTIA